MSTMMSSRRTFVSGRNEIKAGASGWWVAALVGGLLVMALGLHVNVTAIFAVGSIAFACSFMYLNAMFWAKRMDKMDYKPSEYSKYRHM